MSRYPARSQTINFRQANLASAALEQAAALGQLPNYHLTIHWGLTYNADQPVVSLQRFLERMSKWLKRRDVPIAFIWVRENAGNKAEHVHVVFYCPKEHSAAFEVASAKWAAAEDPRAVFLRPCETKPRCNVHTLVRGYLLKGGDDFVRAAFPVPSAERHSRYQGEILGKRLGTSRSLGAAAIGRATASKGPTSAGSN